MGLRPWGARIEQAQAGSMKVSLIISVYKDVVALRTILDALRFQRYGNYEIIVSEDGENEEMKQFLRGYSHPNPVVHLTQPDVGWRKNQALNRAIRESSGEYLIFIDGDCVPHHRFVDGHVRFASPRKIMAGKRVKLGPRFSERFKSEIGTLLTLERKVLTQPFAWRRDGGRFEEEGFYIDPDGLLAFILPLRPARLLKGCNMSFFREAIEAINGFDEDYQLPAVGEDIDLTWRFKGMGYELASVRNLAIQYHLHHKENWSDQSHNRKLLAEKMAAGRFVCSNGLTRKA